MSKSTVFNGMLLVAGTTIGGGMLALPVLTSLAGFWPSIVVYIACWLFMTCTGLLFLEVCLWFKGETNMVSMAEKTLGPLGKASAWVIYLFLFYCLTLAYIVGCGNLLSEFTDGWISDWIGSLIFVALFAPIVYAGARVVGKINFVLMIALIISFLAFVFIGYKYVDPKLLQYRNWMLSLNAMPIAFTSFAYQGIVPTLASYMQYDARKIRFAIVGGSFIPLVVYIIWQGLILGIVPVYGPGGLAEAIENGYNAVYPLKEFLNQPLVYFIGQCFALFAIVTSFLGVTLGLLDFLADGLKVEKTSYNKLWLCALIYIPPLIFAFSHPHIFLQALDYAGGFGCALLLGLFPIAIVWIGRYHLHLKSAYQLPGGKIVLALLAAFVIFEIGFMIKLTML